MAQQKLITNDAKPSDLDPVVESTDKKPEEVKSFRYCPYCGEALNSQTMKEDVDKCCDSQKKLIKG